MKRLVKASRLLLNGKKLANALRHQMAGEGAARENRVHMEAGVNWLMRAQEKGAGGFSSRYCLYYGWDGPYIETTGYIIPTMIAAAKCLGPSPAFTSPSPTPPLRAVALMGGVREVVMPIGESLGEGGGPVNASPVMECAKRAADWLLGTQRADGAFCDGETGLEQVFDTGQVLTGLVAAFREWGDESFLEAAARAGAWLAEVQEEDGSWKRYAYNRIKHTYYVKVSAALLELALMTGDGGLHEAAMKNIRWTLECQESNGYFRHMHFRDEEPPFLHTIIYVLEGLMDSYDLLKDGSILGAVMRTVSALKGINRDREMLLCSQYGENWVPANKERCITGLAQWACIAMRAYDITGDETLLEQSVKTMYYLKSKQYLRPDRDLFGGLPGSVPLWGKYLGFCYPNWGVKFFLDALIAYEKYSVPLWREQEIWVSGSFRFSESVVSGELGANDQKYLMLIEKELDADKDLTVLDIGCGKGKFIRYFREKFPHWTVTGIDPGFPEDKESDIGAGSVYALPVPDCHADVVLLIEVMQHVDDMERAMTELSRVTKDEGCLIIGDRDPFSLIGLLKPLLEMAGRWMYPWDSPFRERWLSVREWERVLGDNWRVSFARSFSDPANRIPMSNRFYLLIARKKGS